MHRMLKPVLTLGLCSLAMTANAIYESQSMAVDKFENYNRNAYRMNDTLDKNFIRPAAVGYITYIPKPIRLVIQNFFNNLRDFVTLGDDILQLNGQDSMHNIMRIAINSTFGILGLIDISSSLGLMQHTNTFGQTMRVYGWKNSSYFMIPFIGPSTVRDALGMIPDTIFNPTWLIIPQQYTYVSVGLFMVNGIDQRAKYLDFDGLLDSSIDPYVTLRDSYLQAHGEIAPQSPNNNSNEVNIDNLIDDNGNSAPTKPATTPSTNNNVNIDTLIDEEGKSAPATKSPSNSMPTPAK